MKPPDLIRRSVVAMTTTLTLEDVMLLKKKLKINCVRVRVRGRASSPRRVHDRGRVRVRGRASSPRRVHDRGRVRVRGRASSPRRVHGRGRVRVRVRGRASSLRRVHDRDTPHRGRVHVHVHTLPFWRLRASASANGAFRRTELRRASARVPLRRPPPWASLSSRFHRRWTCPPQLAERVRTRSPSRRQPP
jgi:hypothetical protein